jgi:hypothetical protein
MLVKWRHDADGKIKLLRIQPENLTESAILESVKAAGINIRQVLLDAMKNGKPCKHVKTLDMTQNYVDEVHS